MSTATAARLILLTISSFWLFSNPFAAVRTRIMLLQPESDTRTVEPVITGQDRDLFSDIDIFHAYRAFGCAVTAQHAGLDFSGGEGVDGGFGCWTGCCASCVLLHELGDDSVEGFL